MRNAIVQLPEQRTENERRQVLRAVIRQLERAEIYVAAVDYMDLGDPEVDRAVLKIRADIVGLQRHLGEQRARIRP